MSIQMNNMMLVRDVMMPINRIPLIEKTVILKEALEEMGRVRLGIACIVDSDNKLLGILTDGDFRRKLLKVQKPFSAFLVDDALDHAIRSPVTIRPTETLVDAISIMGQKQIWDLPVVNEQGILEGLLHLHPAVEALLNGK
ncbi:MAG: CBS domain-containing protein [Legionella sp.]|nr:MAG: CBS domain-containing protein [Legionella sp.]